jgi:hypothetical protein
MKKRVTKTDWKALMRYATMMHVVEDLEAQLAARLDRGAPESVTIRI